MSTTTRARHRRVVTIPRLSFVLLLSFVFLVGAALSALADMRLPSSPIGQPPVVESQRVQYVPRHAEVRVQIAPTPEPINAAGSVNGRPCGGDLPPCWVLRRESNGDPRIWNGRCYAPVGHRGISPCGSSSASGTWQFTRGTWAGYGGCVNAADCPADKQDRKAKATWNGGRGCFHWSAC